MTNTEKLVEILGVSNIHMVSKNQLINMTVDLIDENKNLEKMASNLIFALFCENPNNRIFEGFQESALTSLRTLKFNRGTK